MLRLILGTGIPVAYAATFIATARFLFRHWRSGGKWDIHDDEGVATFFAALVGLFWPVFWLIMGLNYAIVSKQPPTAAEERELRRKAERRLAEAEAELRQATLAANNTSDHHREVTQD